MILDVASPSVLEEGKGNILVIIIVLLIIIVSVITFIYLKKRGKY